MKNLLIELFVEELPPKSLAMLGRAFAEAIGPHLIRRRLRPSGEEKSMTIFATPRRLGALIPDVAEKGRDNPELIKLMPTSVGLSAEGKATPALLKKLQALNLDESVVPLLKKSLDGKAEALFLERSVPGISLAAALQEALEEAVRSLPIPKVMSYQLEDGWTTVKFVRPAHGLVALHGDDVVDVSVLGCKAGRTTQGHRFEASKSLIEIRNADSYAEQLRTEGAVIADFNERRAEIVRQLGNAASKEGLKPIADEALLDEVTALVERPNVLTCQFEDDFLKVPKECLILTMKANQKYFPLLDAAGKLTNKFLVVSNIRPADASRVIGGNERVVRPRLADAKFFYDQDRKQTLASRLERLRKIVYHNRISIGDEGRPCSLFDRTMMVKGLAEIISNYKVFHEVGLPEKAKRAAELSKCDLVTDMVGEFPELQGTMGRYYAEHDGEDREVAQAIFEQYLPRGAGDILPTTKPGIAVALAEKIVTLALIFEIGEKPTGAKDPFGLRRAAIGVLRILIECRIPLDLRQMIGDVWLSRSQEKPSRLLDEIYDYIAERLRGYYLEGGSLPGVTTEMFDAVLERKPGSPLVFDNRLRALVDFLKLEDAQSLAAANKRINNILKKNAEGSERSEVHENLLQEPAEQALYRQLRSAEADTGPLFAAENYGAALSRLAVLRAEVDAFFDSVMVMAEDKAIRDNRLALLRRLRNVFLQVADLSRLPG